MSRKQKHYDIFPDVLQPNRVYVFGSNYSGFHGAGSAGYAMFHKRGNIWRTTDVPGTNKRLDEVPQFTPGYWAVKGVALTEIQGYLADLWLFAQRHPQLEFIITPLGAGYSGYSSDWLKPVSKRRNKLLQRY